MRLPRHHLPRAHRRGHPLRPPATALLLLLPPLGIDADTRRMVLCLRQPLPLPRHATIRHCHAAVAQRIHPCPCLRFLAHCHPRHHARRRQSRHLRLAGHPRCRRIRLPALLPSAECLLRQRPFPGPQGRRQRMAEHQPPLGRHLRGLCLRHDRDRNRPHHLRMGTAGTSHGNRGIRPPGLCPRPRHRRHRHHTAPAHRQPRPPHRLRLLRLLPHRQHQLPAQRGRHLPHLHPQGRHRMHRLHRPPRLLRQLQIRFLRQSHRIHRHNRQWLPQLTVAPHHPLRHHRARRPHRRPAAHRPRG